MEIDFKKLYQLQDKILDIIKLKDFGVYLTGGTALHRFFYHNLRYSEDLDFFSVSKDTNLNDFERILQENNIIYHKEADKDEFKRFIIEQSLKIDLVDATREPHLDDFIMQDGIRLDNKNNILSNKFTAILDRNAPRDAYDIFILLKYNDVDKNKIIKNITQKTANSIDDTFAMLNMFPMQDKFLNTIYFCNDKSKAEFIDEFFDVINNFINKDLQQNNMHTNQIDSNGFNTDDLLNDRTIFEQMDAYNKASEKQSKNNDILGGNKARIKKPPRV